MPAKQQPITKEDLDRGLQGAANQLTQQLEKGLQETTAHILKYLGGKIEASRQDAREQIQSVQKGLNARMDKMDSKFDAFRKELDLTQSVVLETARDVKELKSEARTINKRLDEVVEKVERHDVEIIQMKSAIA